MKKKILFLSLFLGTLLHFCTAQSPKYVNAEFLGSYNLIGSSFDGRFNDNSKFGYKIGFGYGYQKHTGSTNINLTVVNASNDAVGDMFNCYSIPINVHYLIGKEKHFLETSLGITLFATDYSFKNNSDARVGYYSFARIAYRFEPKKIPFLFSIGADMPFQTPVSGLNYSFGIAPSVTIGYKL